LDSLGKANDDGKDGLYMHVSRTPKEGDASFQFSKSLIKFAKRENTNFDLIHKKINLSSELLSWEHERFSLRQISALTLSHFVSSNDIDRTTITDLM
jgi:hypothetical protein